MHWKFILFLWAAVFVHLNVHCDEPGGTGEPEEPETGGTEEPETTEPVEPSEPEFAGDCSIYNEEQIDCENVLVSCGEGEYCHACIYHDGNCETYSGDGGDGGGEPEPSWACSDFNGNPAGCAEHDDWCNWAAGEKCEEMGGGGYGYCHEYDGDPEGCGGTGECTYINDSCVEGVAGGYDECENYNGSSVMCLGIGGCMYINEVGWCLSEGMYCSFFHDPEECESEGCYWYVVITNPPGWCTSFSIGTINETGNGTGNGTVGPACNTISVSNYYDCCVSIQSNYDKCWQYGCGTLDNYNYGSCCQGADALNGGCPSFCSSITASNNATCCSGSNPASNCFSYTCGGSVTSGNYGTCCTGAQTAAGCTAACEGTTKPAQCPVAGCVTISGDNYVSCCVSNTSPGCNSYKCATAENIAGNYGTCCGSIGKGAGCDEYCETSDDASCPVNPCAVIHGSNYGACCTESSTACSNFCTSNPSSDFCKTSGSSVISVHMAGLLLLICFLLTAF